MVSDMEERMVVLGRYNDNLEQCQKLALETADIPLEHLGRSYEVASEFTKYPMKMHLMKSYKNRIIPEANNQKKIAAKKWIRIDAVIGASDEQKEKFRQHIIKLMKINVVPKNPDSLKRFGILASEL